MSFKGAMVELVGDPSHFQDPFLSVEGRVAF